LRSTSSHDPREWALSVIAAQPSLNGGGIASQLHRVCAAAVVGLEMIGAVVSMRSPQGSEAIVAHSGRPIRAVAELEFGLGEGPTLDSWTTGQPQFVSDLTLARATWVAFAPAAIEAGIQAAYALPLQVGAARFGAFTMYDAVARQLGQEETGKALVLADLATEMLLDSSAKSPDGAIDPHLESALDLRSEIYQAQGMLMVALRVGLPEALARMRAHSFATGRALVDVARDIIDGRLDFADDSDDDHSTR
ncbi:MAG: GAF and ANTAR domain-containing protein, partial [Nocardioides sp.]